jgi:hypothetical protein
MYRAYERGVQPEPGELEEEYESLKGSIALAIAILILRFSLSFGGFSTIFR